MKKLHAAFLLVLILVLSLDCRKELSYTGVSSSSADNILSAPVIATLQGNVLDENDQPADGVKITAGSKTTITNASGYFRIINAALDKNASLVIAEKDKYFKTYRTFNATAGVNQVVIKLIKKIFVGSVPATTGGELTLSNGAKVSLPAHATGKESNGSLYSGNINVYASYINPVSPDINKIIPGSLMANDKNNTRVTLTSFGMMAVVLESTSGEKLQILKGSGAKLTIPIPSSLQPEAPKTISLWFIDEQSGLWKEDGLATKNGTNYIGEVKHFSYWNCDFSKPAITLSMTLKNSSGLPLVYAATLIKADTGGAAHGYTDSLGQVRGLVPANENLMLQVLDECGATIYSQNIGPFTENTDLGTITATSTSSIITIKGRLVDCNNNPVPRGYAYISYNNMVRYTSADNNGSFSVTLVTCSSIQSGLDIFGADPLSLQQSLPVKITVNAPETEAGNLSTCGTVVGQFIKFNLDGTEHNLINPTFDSSLFVYIFPTPLPTYTSYIGGDQFGTYINFEFVHDQAPGVYKLNRLSVSNFNNCVLSQPLNVTIANYPDNIGDVYEGNFSGQFKDSLNLTSLHNISCSFKLKRQQ